MSNEQAAYELLCQTVCAYSTSTVCCKAEHAKTSYRKGSDILRWSVIFRGKTSGVTIRAPVSSKIFFSTQVPPSKHLSSTLFSPFRSLKTRLQVPSPPPTQRFVFSSAYFIFWSTCTVYHLSYSCGILHKEPSHFPCYSTTRAKAAVSRKYTSVIAGSVLRSCLRGKHQACLHCRIHVKILIIFILKTLQVSLSVHTRTTLFELQ